MASHDVSSKDARATVVPVDLEHGNRHQITPSGSSSLTPEEPLSKAATPTLRRSFEVDDAPPRQRTFHNAGLWTSIEKKVPAPVTRWSRKVVDWTKGPELARTYRITPLFERIQTFPVRILGRLPQWLRVCIYSAALILWIVLFAVILTKFSMPSDIAGFGKPLGLSCVTNLW
jgi:hypothetical protein